MQMEFLIITKFFKKKHVIWLYPPQTGPLLWWDDWYYSGKQQSDSWYMSCH